jgi:hypothetical protein
MFKVGFENFLKQATDQELEHALQGLSRLQTIAVTDHQRSCEQRIRAIRAEQAIRPTERFLQNALAAGESTAA